MKRMKGSSMKEKLLVIFGGSSSEHEVSCKSVINIVKSVDKSRYELLLLGITKEGKWLLLNSLSEIEDGSWYKSKIRANLLPDRELKSLYIQTEAGEGRLERIDIIFPVLHGINGEDGTIQGLFELCGIPYVGCGVLASAVSMDKLFTKIIAEAPLRAIGARQARYISIVGEDADKQEQNVERVESELSYPVFVKPSSAGSSCGVSKASNREELLAAIKKAYSVDRKVLVEECIVGRELECAVIRGSDMVSSASGVGEIKAAAEFYDYDAKYNNPQSKTVIKPELTDREREWIREAAIAVFEAVDGYGLSRVDFFLTDNGLVFNEINTLPGFTAISMYPMLWEAEGVTREELVQRLLDTAALRPGFGGEK